MPEMMISRAQTPPPNAPGSANPLGNSDPVARSDARTEPNPADGTAPFADTLKARMGKNADGAEASQRPDAASSKDPAEATNSEPLIDLAAIFPFLGFDSTGKPSLQTEPGSLKDAEAGDKAQPEIETATTIPAALPLVTAAVGTGVNLPAEKSSALAPVIDDKSRRQSAATRDQAFTPGKDPQLQGAENSSGKLESDAAITADKGVLMSEQRPHDNLATDFRALMDRASAMASTSTGTGSSPSTSQSLRVDTPMGQAGWHNEMGQKLTWMIGNHQQQADLVLNPPQLGRIEVSLTMNGDQATAIFTSPNPAVRETLENSLHRLREVLADAGVSLGQAQVGSESPHQSSSRNQSDSNTTNTNDSMRYASTIPLPTAQPVTRAGAGRSMIDIFA